MRAAKKGLARRAFQEVPRELRRRTASHNPQRVPKRLRPRARREAKEDNTPIVRGKSGSGLGKGKKKWLRDKGIAESRKRWEERKRKRTAKKNDPNVIIEPMDGIEATVKNQVVKPRPKRKRLASLATPETPPSRFRRRQKDKTWLPTHLWHTKRSRMTLPTEPLWRFALPLAPVAKAYRLTHRASSLRGAVTWDMSYISTISLEGIEVSITGLLKSLRFAEEDGDDPWQDRGRAKKWRNGTRTWEGWIHTREERPVKNIAHITVLWCVPEEGSNKRKVFLRVHPSAFLQLWNEVVRTAKVQKPAVAVEDLRYEIGSIEIMGPAAAETLVSTLHPSTSNFSPGSPQSLWSTLAPVTNVGVFPPGALLSFPICDPRLRDPPQPAQIVQDGDLHTTLTSVLAEWPIDQTQSVPAIFDRKSRMAAVRSLQSQKSINRRMGASTLGAYPEPRSTDPQIPMLSYISKNSQSWIVLLPWKCVTPVWRSIMRYPVSTGGNPRFGGLKERRQVDFEHSTPSFPFDYPSSDAGWGWEIQERAARKQEWVKRPKGKRIEWSTIDLGNERIGEVGDPWACAWERFSTSQEEIAVTQSPLRQVPSRDALDLMAGRLVPTDYTQGQHVFTAKISMVQRGTPTTCARVYRLPTNNAELRSKWLALMVSSGTNSTKNGNIGRSYKGGKSARPIESRDLALSILVPPQARDGPPKAGDEDYPVVPDEEDLIGFVTTGNYNLAEGMPTAIANLVLNKVKIEGCETDRRKGVGQEGRVCIVREAGRTIGRLATWDVV